MYTREVRVLEIGFLIVSIVLVLQNPPVFLESFKAYNLPLETFLVVFMLCSAAMVFASVIRILNEGRLFTNLFAGIVYFVNVIHWINVV